MSDIETPQGEQPTSDLQLEAQAAVEQPATPEATPEPTAEQPNDDKPKRNRTGEYIKGLQAERAELKAELQRLKAQQNAPRIDVGNAPTIEQYNYDTQAFQHAQQQYFEDQAQNYQQSLQEQLQQEYETQQQLQVWGDYEQRAIQFMDEHPDYLEVVNSIPYPFGAELQAAIAAHPQGPAIAYHLGNNDEDAFAIASIQPHLAAAAVNRIASRLGTAHQPAPPVQVPQPKPITQAPMPPPTVGGRSPAETPVEKLTDDEWLAREQDKRRK